MTTMKRIDSEEESDEEICQICLLQKPLLALPCTHKACQQCLERIFLVTTYTSAHREEEDDLELLQDRIVNSCPTRGRCPFCRSAVNMFDLIKHDCGRDLSVDKEEEDSGGEENLIYEKNVDLRGSCLNNLTFSTQSRQKKSLSFIDGVPEFSFFNYNENDEENHLIRKHRFDEYFFHEKSLTFSGAIQWSKPPAQIEESKPSQKEDSHDEVVNEAWEGVDRWEVVVQFSSDMRFARHGAIIKIKMDGTNQKQIDFPLDGKWLVRHIYSPPFSINEVNFSKASRLNVVHNKFEFFGISYNLCYGESEAGDKNETNAPKAYFDWPEMNVRQVVESGIDLQTQPNGPDINAVVVWNVNHRDYHRILWKRVTKGTEIPPLQVECIGSQGTTFYSEHSRPQPSGTIAYNRNSPDGNVFIQAHKVGLASYHFVSVAGQGEEGVYISYEHEQCSAWPSLDDGSPVPYRVPFANISYDAETRTFTGKIPWMEVYGTTWNGCREWNYVMVFDSQFTCIVSGNVSMGRHVFHDSIYGETLNYYNAAIIEILKSGATGARVAESSENEAQNNVNATTEIRSQSRESAPLLNQNDTNESSTDASNIMEENDAATVAQLSVMNYLNMFKERLRNEGATHRTLYIISRASHGALDGARNPIDYNGMNTTILE